MKLSLMTVTAALLLSSFTLAPEDNEPEKSAGIKKENRDESVRPGDDFFQFANGGWMKANPLTPEYSRYGSFEMLEAKTNDQLHTLMEDLVKTPHERGTVAQKVADLYKLAMDSVRRNNEGVTPVKADLQRIESLQSREQLFTHLAQMSIEGQNAFFGSRIGTERENSRKKLLSISQGGTGMQQKDYYVENTPSVTKVRDAYKSLIVDLLGMVGYADAQSKMEQVMSIENRLANASLSRTEMRDPSRTYHKISYTEFKNRYNKLDWDAFFKIQGIAPKDVNVMVLEYMDEVQNILTTESMDALKSYLEWCIVRGATSQLNDAVESRAFDFNGKVMTGSTSQGPRWKRSLNMVNRAMGMALGQMYCEKYFPAENKERMLALVKNLLVATGKRIDAQAWMSDATKKRAHEKLDKFNVKIGYPDKWTDYSALDIDPSKSLYENMKAVSVWNYWDRAKKFDQEPDRSEMRMTPQTVNASYSSTNNDITFPAGILQYPFFDMSADDAFNYGAIGVVIGHEITHGFDDNGARYDGDGNFRNWWEPADEKLFKEKGDQLASWFDNIVVLKGENGEADLHGNGRVTLGENLADHGGLEISWVAYNDAVKGKKQEVKDGLTAPQRFFLAYSGIWGQNIREAEIRRRTKSDEHSLGRWRVNGTLPHIDAWYEAWNIKPGDKLYLAPEKRVSVW